VRSPTYTLVDTYSTPELDLVHVDLYRLRSSAEVEELGLRDLTGPDSLMLIEWPEQAGPPCLRPIWRCSSAMRVSRAWHRCVPAASQVPLGSAKAGT